jgi:membrane-associated protein
MESILNFICAHAENAHWIFFGLLLLAGLSIPISEDLILLTAGAIANICIPEHAFRLFIWVFIGCWVSAWEAYWIGRKLGPKLYEIRWFRHILTPKRTARLHHYYEKFGIFTFIVGRFIPGGARNALFMTSGLGKMPFLTFVFRDGFACFISSNVLFFLGYLFAENYKIIIKYFKTYDLIALIIFLLAIATGLFFLVWRSRSKSTIQQNDEKK